MDIQTQLYINFFLSGLALVGVAVIIYWLVRQGRERDMKAVEENFKPVVLTAPPVIEKTMMVSKPAPADATNADRILASLDGKAKSTKEIAAELQMNHNTAGAYLTRLKKKNLVKITPKGWVKIER